MNHDARSMNQRNAAIIDGVGSFIYLYYDKRHKRILQGAKWKCAKKGSKETLRMGNGN